MIGIIEVLAVEQQQSNDTATDCCIRKIEYRAEENEMFSADKRHSLDLLRDGEDLSLIANVFGDARKTYREVEERAFADKVDELGGRYGLRKNCSLYERLGGSK